MSAIRIVFFFGFAAVYFPLFSQIKIEPRVIVLYPHETVASEKIKEALKEYESEIEITDEIRKNYVKEDLSENWRIIRTQELEFLRKQDFFSLFAYTMSTSLIYKLYNLHDYPLVFPVKETCAGDMNAMKAMAQKYDADWVVNFTEITLSENLEKTATAKVMLYNTLSHRIFFNLSYTGNGDNPGEGLECEEGSWDCTANNVVSKALVDIFDRLEKNRKYWRQ